MNRLLHALMVLGMLAAVAAAPAASKKTKSKDYAKLPDWVREAAEMTVEGYDASIDAVDLLDTQTVEIDSTGRKRERTRFAFKALTLEARDQAYPSVSFHQDTDTVESFSAWLVLPDGGVIVYGKNDIVERTPLGGGSIATDSRYRQIDARGDIVPGAVLLWESTVRRYNVYGNYRWFFQGGSPRIRSRIEFALPSGWEVEPTLFNNDAGLIERVPGEWAWEAKRLPGAKGESGGPDSQEYLAWGGFRIAPPPSWSRVENFRSFDSWEDMAMFHSDRIYTQRRQTSPSLVAKAHELAKDSATNWEKCVAMAEYVRSVNYTNISIALGKGNGFVPREPSEVFETNWGDCKDKANLLCAMLAEVGVEAYPLVVNVAERSAVVEAWPGDQFNHCITAVRADDSFLSPSVIDRQGLGRLFIVDTTDEYTAIGDLNQMLQGTKGLLVAPQGGGLMPLPVLPPDSNARRLRVQAEILANGNVVGSYRWEADGQMGASCRYQYRMKRSDAAFREWLSGVLSGSLINVKLTEPEVVDNAEVGKISVAMDFGSPGYAKAMGGRLITCKPVLIDRRESVWFENNSKGERKQPLILDTQNWDDVFEIYLPLGFALTSKPEPMELSAPFGRYALGFEHDVANDILRVSRRMEISSQTIPVESYGAAKSFFEQMVKAELAPIVLERK